MKDRGKLLPQDRTRGGRDELNLTEFPIALLSDRPSKKNPSSLRFETGDKVWEIAGHPDHGLPTAGDVAVYVCLMELTREQEYPTRVRFTRHDLLQRLGWSRGAHEYARVQLALDRLVGVTITSTNAYYDARDRKWLRRHAFHVLEEYKITDVRQAALLDEPDSWFRWSEAISRNLQAGYIKTLNVPLFLSLKSSISQTLYRYLDAKIRDGKPLFRQGLRDLAYQHLGLSRDYYPSQIKRKLAPAHEELIAAGFMTRAEYARRQDGDEMVVYQFPQRAISSRLSAVSPAKAERAVGGPRSAVSQEAVGCQSSAVSGEAVGCRPSAVGGRGVGYQPSAVSPAQAAFTDGRQPTADGPLTDGRQPTADGPLTDSREPTADNFPTDGRQPAADSPTAASLVQHLVAIGVTRSVAEQLVRTRPEEVATQLRYWPYREAKSNPAGALRHAIEEEWPPPPRWQEAQKQREQAAKARQRREKEQARAQQAAAADCAFDAWWSALPEAERAAYREQAEAELIGENPILAQYYQRNPESLPKALRPILMRRMR